jgi:NAD(P)H-dependent FMN reductase
MAQSKLKIIVASGRPGRVGLPIGKWIHDRAARHGGFDVDLIDLEELNLPFLNEPNHPRLRQYTQEHTREWSRRIDEADAFVLVTPEYNHSFNARMKNAIDYLHHEWQYKAVGFVSYGGVSAGTRSVQMLTPVLTALKMMPMFESVSIPFVRQVVDGEGNVKSNEKMEEAATTMLDEIARWTTALTPLRDGNKSGD